MPTWKGSFSSSFDIFSNDPDERQVTIHLNGRGLQFTVSPNEGTIGSKIQITGSGFGTIAGSVLMGGTSLDVLEWSNETILCSLSKAVPATIYGLMIQPIGMLPVVEEYTFTIKAPVIESVKSDGLGREQITIRDIILEPWGRSILERPDAGLAIGRWTQLLDRARCSLLFPVGPWSIPSHS